MFEGIITPIVTPFNRDEEQTINFEAAGKLIDYLIDNGVDGIFPLGSNGEFHVLSFDEKTEFIDYVVKKVNKRVPVYAGTGACSTNEAIALSKKAEVLGADALSVITPYFIKPSTEELVQYYKDIAASVNIPIILYNIPKNTGCPILPEVLEELVSIDNVRGIKDSSGDLENIKAYIEIAKGTNVHILVGSDSKISAGYELGATGAIAGTSNLITETLVSLFKALKGGNQPEAKKCQEEIEVLRAALKLGTVPVILKRAIEMAGIAEVGPARKPVQETTPEVDKEIQKMLDFYFN